MGGIVPDPLARRLVVAPLGVLALEHHVHCAPNPSGGGPLEPGEILHLDAHPGGPVADQGAAHNPAPRVERVAQDGPRRAVAARRVARRRAGRCWIEEPIAPRRVVDPGDARSEGGRARAPHLEADIEAVLAGLATSGRRRPQD